MLERELEQLELPQDIEVDAEDEEHKASAAKGEQLEQAEAVEVINA